MKPRGSRDVDAYLAGLPAESRATLQKIRQATRVAVPGAEEGISYGLPAFRLAGRPLVWYGAFKDHCSIFPGSTVLRKYARELKGYKTSRGTIRSSAERPLPPYLVQTLVKARIAELRTPKK